MRIDAENFDSDEFKRILTTMNDEQIDACVSMAELLGKYRERLQAYHLLSEKWDDLSLAIHEMRFDLDCTRKERDDLQAKLDALGGGS